MERYSNGDDHSSSRRGGGGEEEEEEEEEIAGMTSCWGRLKLMLPWKRRSKRVHRIMQENNNSSSMDMECGGGGGGRFNRIKRPQKRIRGKQKDGSFRYSPLSYAQNFDEWVEENEDDSSVLVHNFSSRFAAPYSHKKASSN
ncbi:hypothetical protein M9H77_32258 [Catharanthus roseus]|uniref:Uncharacterized protein n=1 Tax=Catharanthus roseus TaxID=4058 RepID=A0ACC0A3C2_CATRO|nr:hypothetical protein M9H77_32258 [Catharanthus roseus]